MCIVTPIARRSLTLRTLLITSRPRSSKTRTFQMGSPSGESIAEAALCRLPSGLALPSSASSVSTLWLRLSIFLIEAVEVVSVPGRGAARGEGPPTYLLIPQRGLVRRHLAVARLWRDATLAP